MIQIELPAGAHRCLDADPGEPSAQRDRRDSFRLPTQMGEIHDCSRAPGKSHLPLPQPTDMRKSFNGSLRDRDAKYFEPICSPGLVRVLQSQRDFVKILNVDQDGLSCPNDSKAEV